MGTLAFGSVMGGCAATPTSDSTGQYVDDTAITTKVKSALLGDDAVKSFEIKVETVKKVVQLSGFVDSAEEKATAAEIARGIDVIDQLATMGTAAARSSVTSPRFTGRPCGETAHNTYVKYSSPNLVASSRF